MGVSSSPNHSVYAFHQSTPSIRAQTNRPPVQSDQRPKQPSFLFLVLRSSVTRSRAQRSFLDHLLHGTGAGGSNGQRPVDDHHEPAHPSVPTTVVSCNEGHLRVVTTNDDAAAAPGLRDGCAAAGVGQAAAAAALEAAAPRGRVSVCVCVLG